jgi:hypothetical protein
MFGILMTACTVLGTCTDVVLQTQSEPIAPHSCMQQAMPEMVKWIREHPEFTIKGWSCGVLKDLKVSI